MPLKLLLGLLAVVAIVHTSSIVGDYVLDDHFIDRDQAFDDFWSFQWFSLTHRPVGKTFFAAQVFFLGDAAWISHVVNVLIHLAAVTGWARLIELILQRTCKTMPAKRRWAIAAAAAILWALHPLTTNVVTYSIQRFESLAAAGMIWSVYFWLRAFSIDNGESVSDSPKAFWWLGSMALAGFAFGSKEISAGLPIILVMCDRYVLRSSWQETYRHLLGPALLLTPIVYAAWKRIPVLMDDQNPFRTVGFNLPGIASLDYVIVQPLVYLQYLRLLLFPSGLVLDYGWVPADFSALYWLGIVGWIAIVGLVVLAWRYVPIVGLAGTTILLILATTSLIPTQDLIFEHRFYLPSAILIAVSLIAICVRFDVRMEEKLSLVVIAVIAILLSFGTIMRNLDYVSELNLARVDLEKQPNNPRGHYNIAVLDETLSKESFRAHLQRAIELSEQRNFFCAGAAYKYRRDMADFHYFDGNLVEARHWYQAALPESNDELQRAEVILSLAMIASASNQIEEANALFEQGISLDTEIKQRIKDLYQVHLQRAAQATDESSKSSVN